MPTDPNDPLSNQKIKDRYHGVNDPVAEKLLSSAQDLPTLSPPDDKTVTSLYIGGIDESFNQSDLRYVTLLVTWCSRQCNTCTQHLAVR